jgi:hypothetical protein
VNPSSPESKSAIISQIIAPTMEADLVRADEKVGGSRKVALPTILGRSFI